jgi:hypothetical protein
MTTTVSLRDRAPASEPTHALSQKTPTLCLMVYAAVTFWISWYLMPDPGTTDAAHILAIVGEWRTSVLASVLIQITSALAYLVALFLLVRMSAPQKTAMVGIVLFGIGAMGLCSDAFFHLLAYAMTNGAVTMGDNVVEVMHLMQTQGVVVLLPILLPFFIGSLVLAIGLAGQGATSRRPACIIVAGIVVGVLGTLIATKLFGYQGRLVTLTALGLFSLGHAAMALELPSQRNAA